MEEGISNKALKSLRTRNVAGVGVGGQPRAHVASNETPLLYPQASTKDKRIPLSWAVLQGGVVVSTSSGPYSHSDSTGPRELRLVD